jgi:hypothetical protein
VAREQPRSPRLVGDPLIEAAGAQILGLLGEFEFAAIAAGALIQPTRKPGASVLEKLLR